MISRRSLLLIAGMIAILVLLAATLDAFGIGGQLLPSRDPINSGSAEQNFPPAFLRDLPRVIGALASVVALSGYGLLLGALMPQRLGTVVRAIIGGPQQAVQLGLRGLLLAVLVVSTLLLGIVSGIVGLATPAFAFGFALLLTGGYAACAMAVGRWLRDRIGALEHEPVADLVTGTVLFSTISLLPYVGGFALGVTVCVGLGALASTGGGATERWQPAQIDY